MHLDFDLRWTGEAASASALNTADVEELFYATCADVSRTLERKLAGVRCVEHDAEPLVRVIMSYDRDTDQMDVSYNVEACCPPFLLRVVQILHRTGS